MSENNAGELMVAAKKQMVGDGPNEILLEKLRKTDAVVDAELVIKSQAEAEEKRHKKYKDTRNRYDFLISKLGARLYGVHMGAVERIDSDARKILEEKVIALAKQQSRLHKFLAAACGIAYVALPAGLGLAGYFKEIAEGLLTFLFFWFMFGWVPSVSLYFSDHSELMSTNRYLLEHKDDAPQEKEKEDDK